MLRLAIDSPFPAKHVTEAGRDPLREESDCEDNERAIANAAHPPRIRLQSNSIIKPKPLSSVGQAQRYSLAWFTNARNVYMTTDQINVRDG
jgi:hypothetical protein